MVILFIQRSDLNLTELTLMTGFVLQGLILIVIKTVFDYRDLNNLMKYCPAQSTCKVQCGIKARLN